MWFTKRFLRKVAEHKKAVLYVVFLALSIIVAVELALLLGDQRLQGGDGVSVRDDLHAIAEQAIDFCKNDAYRPSCYDKEIPKLTESISMEDAFEVTRIVQEQDEGYWYCHVLGHDLSARETAKDLNAWKSVVARCPSGMCSNGCLHGAFQERFRTDALPELSVSELKPELIGICDAHDGWSPTGLERGTCAHALGHLTMYITKANIEKATTLCDELELRKEGSDLAQLCYDGAFMQIFQPLDPEDFALIKGKEVSKENHHRFCAQFKDQKQGACWSEGWPLHLAEIKRPAGLVAFCGEMKSNAREYERCFKALFYVVTAQFNFDEKKIINFCSGLPKEHQGTCFANAASRLIETDWRLVDRSVDICNSAAVFGVEKACYDELLFYSQYNFKVGTQELSNLCEKLPDGWKQRCHEGKE